MQHIIEICSYCQKPYSENNPKTIDHIIPKCKIGEGHLRNQHLYFLQNSENLLECCRRCNLLKGSLTLDEFVEKLKLETPFRGWKRVIQSIEVLRSNQEDLSLRLPYLTY